MPVHHLANLEMLVAKLSTIDTARPLRRQQPRVDIPTSDYVRRTLTLRAAEGGAPIFRYEENLDDPRP